MGRCGGAGRGLEVKADGRTSQHVQAPVTVAKAHLGVELEGDGVEPQHVDDRVQPHFLAFFAPFAGVDPEHAQEKRPVFADAGNALVVVHGPFDRVQRDRGAVPAVRALDRLRRVAFLHRDRPQGGFPPPQHPAVPLLDHPRGLGRLPCPGARPALVFFVYRALFLLCAWSCVWAVWVGNGYIRPANMVVERWGGGRHLDGIQVY